METPTPLTRIAGLVVDAPTCALVVLRREGDVWHVEKAESVPTGPNEPNVYGCFENPGCPIIVDAAHFWQDAQHQDGQTKAAQWIEDGWDVRPPTGGADGEHQQNPGANELTDAVGRFVGFGFMKVDRYNAVNESPAKHALHLAIWAALGAEFEHANAAVLAALLERLEPHQRAIVDALEGWLAGDQPLAIVTGDRRIGKHHTVRRWATLHAPVMEIEPKDDKGDEELFARLKQGHCDLTVIYSAERMDQRIVAAALQAGRVVLVVDVPQGGGAPWLTRLLGAVRAGDAAALLVEKRPERLPLPTRVERLVNLVDPEGAW